MLRDQKAKKVHNFVLFPHDKLLNFLKEFMARPCDYLSDSAPQPVIFPSVCLTGPPKSGKTCLAKRVSLDLDLVYLTVPDILNSILEAKDVSNLHERVSFTLIVLKLCA